MHSANSTMWLRGFVFVFFSVLSFHATGQDNTPYSRYGIGDLVPNRSIASRSMGGVSIGFSVDSSRFSPPVSGFNLANPASLGSFKRLNFVNTIFEVGAELDRRTLRSNTSPDSYTSNNLNVGYVQLGFPIASKKMEARGITWGISVGLRPVTRINYKIEQNKRSAQIGDSLQYLYEGNGGVSQANFSTGIKIKNLSLGFSTGYSFGSKDYNTRLSFLNDSVYYYASNSESRTRFGGMFLNIGAQYQFILKKGMLQIGAVANLQQRLSATRDTLDETFNYDANGNTYSIDTIGFGGGIKGKVQMPASYSFGVAYTNSNWLIGADLDLHLWNSYRYFEKKDNTVQDNFTVRVGAQFVPGYSSGNSSKYLRRVKYRAGFYFGPDYVNLGVKRNEYSFTFGGGLPLTMVRPNISEFVTLNLGAEVGVRGNKNSVSIRENFARFHFGLSMGQFWFQKRRYD